MTVVSLWCGKLDADGGCIFYEECDKVISCQLMKEGEEDDKKCRGVRRLINFVVVVGHFSSRV